tara:strand:+ start:1830 stop:2210 length:381 start_codon:yes stop_codon:yes gene_type:complete
MARGRGGGFRGGGFSGGGFRGGGYKSSSSSVRDVEVENNEGFKEIRDVSPVTIQKQIFDTRDDKKIIMMKIFKIILGLCCLFIGLYLLAMIQQKPNDISKLILEALFVYFGIMIFNKSLPFKIFML